MAIVPYIIIVLLVVIDQVTKLIAQSRLQPIEKVELIPGFIRLRFVLNDGAAFSMLRNARWLFVIVTGIAIIVCLFALHNKTMRERFPALHSPAIKTALVLISAGGLGNLIDRVFRGTVIDFIEPTFVNFAVFNFADILVTLGAAIIIIYLVFDIVFDFRQKHNYVKNCYTR